MRVVGHRYQQSDMMTFNVPMSKTIRRGIFHTRDTCLKSIPERWWRFINTSALLMPVSRHRVLGPKLKGGSVAPKMSLPTVK